MTTEKHPTIVRPACLSASVAFAVGSAAQTAENEMHTKDITASCSEQLDCASQLFKFITNQGVLERSVVSGACRLLT